MVFPQKQSQRKSQKKIKPSNSPTNSDNLVSAKEARQLLSQQKQIMKNSQNIDFYSQISTYKNHLNEKNVKTNSQKVTINQNYPPTNQPDVNIQRVQTNNQSIQKSLNSKQKIKKYKDLTPMISKDELQQLIMQNNLSGVSQNFDNILNESDLNETQNLKMFMNSLNSNNTNNQKNFMNKKNKIFNEDNENGQNSFGNSLNYTQSKISKFKDSLKQKDDKKNHVNQQQFTLNPNIPPNSHKFQSIYTPNQDQVNDEVEEDIYQSCYEESMPKDKNLLPLKTKMKNLQNQQNNRQKIIFSQYKIPAVITDLPAVNRFNQEQSKNFQNLIQNPPNYSSKLKNDKKSMLSERQSEIKGQMQQENQQTQNVSENWIQILKLVEHNQINEAFENALTLNDPIYLLRLLIITKSPLNKLTADTTCKLWTQFLNIYKHKFISVLFTQVFCEAHQLQLVKSALTIQQINESLVELYQISGTTKGKLSYNSAQLYNKIDKCVKKNQ